MKSLSCLFVPAGSAGVLEIELYSKFKVQNTSSNLPLFVCRFCLLFQALCQKKSRCVTKGDLILR
jgi:hypothetical protein